MQVPVRQGLPRVPGGAPWPPVTTAEVAQAPRAAADAETKTAEAAEAPTTALITVPLRRGLPRTPGGAAWPEAETAQIPAPKQATTDDAPAEAVAQEPAADLVTVPLRRGLPRTPGGAPWPEAETAQIPAPKHAPQTAAPEESAAADSTPEPVQQPAQPKPTPQRPAPQKRQAAGKAAPETKPSKAPWLWGAALVVLAAIGVLAARWFVGTETGADFITRYDGRQPLPDSAPVGLPSWLAWSHFFNMFLMAMLVKTGLTQRREAKPAAYWAPRTRPREKISVNLWLHLVLDMAWVVLGVIFYVLLFATGQWMRIVPTSWEVFPHALSAGIQYLSLDWPSENPWVYYNALQELSYFLVVFVASPLAIISGARMSPVWPKRWTFPSMRTARALHFPTMIFFVVFLLIHIVLVATTGLRGNLNAMFAATDDPTGWTGTILFVVAAAIIAGGWALARPMLIAPLAAKTGNVTQR